MNTEQLRAEFEALEKTRFGYNKDTLVRYPTDEDEYYMPLTQARWEGYQAGRAALQSQDREDAERFRKIMNMTRAERGGVLFFECDRDVLNAIDHARRVDRPVIGPHGQVLVDQGIGANRAVIGPYGQVISRRIEGEGE